jgi:hypothetical protein
MVEARPYPSTLSLQTPASTNTILGHETDREICFTGKRPPRSVQAPDHPCRRESTSHGLHRSMQTPVSLSPPSASTDAGLTD